MISYLVHYIDTIRLAANSYLFRRSDEGLTLETSAFYPLRWLVYVFNPVVNTNVVDVAADVAGCLWPVSLFPFCKVSKYCWWFMLNDKNRYISDLKTFYGVPCISVGK